MPSDENQNATLKAIQRQIEKLRESVLAMSGEEGAARAYLEEQERDVRDHYPQAPCLLLQAMPLTRPDWDLRTDEVDSIVRGQNRERAFGVNFSLGSPRGPQPTIKGFRGCDSSSDPHSITDIHRNGYVQAWQRVSSGDFGGVSQPFLDSSYLNLLYAFCDFLDKIWGSTGTDSPYILRLQFLNASGAVFRLQKPSVRLSEPYDRPVLAWEDQMEQAGESLELVRTTWFEQMYEGFGLTRSME